MIRNCVTVDFKYIPSHIEKVIYLSVDYLGLSFSPQILDILFCVICYLFFVFLFLFFFLLFMFFFLSFFVFISKQEQEQL